MGTFFMGTFFMGTKTVEINPAMTARVKISQNVDILAMVYLVHLTLL